jgi:hypothetical protein
MNMRTTMKQQEPTAFDEKWPPSVAALGYSQVPNCLLRGAGDLNLHSSEMLILLLLNTFDYGSKEVWPAQNTLARLSGLSYSAVRANIVKLEQKGFIMRIAQEGMTNLVDMRPLVSKLVQYAASNPASKQAPPYHSTKDPPPPPTGTKEDESLTKHMNKTDRINFITEKKKDLYKNF